MDIDGELGHTGSRRGTTALFYEGRGNVGAVVTHGNYAVGGGQIRTNGIGFGNSTGGWVLHEFRADSCASRQSNCTPGQSLLRMDTVKGTPLSELFKGDQPIGAVIDTDTWDDLVDEWTLGFSTGSASGMIDDNDNGIADRLEELLAPELRGTDPQTGFGLTVELNFKSFSPTRRIPRLWSMGTQYSRTRAA